MQHGNDKMNIKRSIAAIVAAVTLFFSGFQQVYAYQVFPSTGHKCKEQMLKLDSYTYVRKNADGWWMMPWNFRSGYLSAEDFYVMFSTFSHKNLVVEMNATHVGWGTKEPDPVQLKVAVGSGADIRTIMAYNERVNGSVLTRENIQRFKALYGDKYLLVSNVRRWGTSLQNTFSHLDGISFEFQIPEKFAGLWSQVARAVQWAHANNKYIYLLTPPGHDKANLNGGYITAYKDFFNFMRSEVGDKILKSDRIVFVPSNYNYDKTNIQMTPETEMIDGKSRDANTVMGVSKWLLEQPLHRK